MTKEKDKLDTEKYDHYAKDIHVVRGIMDHCGVFLPDFAFSHEFDSPYLRFTQDEPARAVLFKEDSPDALIKIRVKNAPDKKQYWTVPEFVAACGAKKRICHLGKGEQAAWWLRALIETSSVVLRDGLPPVRSKKLPGDIRGSVKKIYEGFISLIKIRLLYDREQVDHPYAYDFIRSWCDIGSNTTVSKGLTWLKENEYLRETRREEYKPGFMLPFYALCIESIEEIVERRDVPSLIDALGDTDDNVRKLALRTLVRIGEPAVESLIGELEKEDIQSTVMSILEHIGKPSVEHLIIAAREGSEGTRQQAIITLARIKDRAALKILDEALDDDNPDVRDKAARALIVMLDPIERQPLRDRIDKAISKKDEW